MTRTWLNYQQEIALRHMEVKKNQMDGVRSTPFVPFRDIIAFADCDTPPVRLIPEFRPSSLLSESLSMWESFFRWSAPIVEAMKQGCMEAQRE